MTNLRFSLVTAVVTPLAALLACSSSEDHPAPAPCNVAAQSGCDQGTVCESLESGATACFSPVVVTGHVRRSSDQTAIAGARIFARDINGASVSRKAAVSDAAGAYTLELPATRKADGTPMLGATLLRADASGFASFPGGLRAAVPLDLASVTKNAAGAYAVANASADVELDALAETRALGTIRGTITAPDAVGSLVVAGGATALAERDGTFVVFNVPAGSQEVRGYRAGLSLKPATATVTAGADTTGVVLAIDSAPLATVSGDVSFVNASASSTSVVLVVKSTFNATIARGEVPAGLRAANVSGKYSFANVPAGQYVVLAAFENDGLVRDPDTSIGGTTTQEITVGSSPVVVPSFKITGALAVVRPGGAAPEIVNGTPTFVFKDDSSEDGYELRVFDGFGKVIWEKLDVPAVMGSSDVSVVYGGPALSKGYFQFRATSFRAKQGGKTYISATEDLQGVFIVH